eukprot:85841-Lingulodinium_polyedra.AAC.1
MRARGTRAQRATAAPHPAVWQYVQCSTGDGKTSQLCNILQSGVLRFDPRNCDGRNVCYKL